MSEGAKIFTSKNRGRGEICVNLLSLYTGGELLYSSRGATVLCAYYISFRYSLSLLLRRRSAS